MDKVEPLVPQNLEEANDCLKKLSQSPILAFDLEFDREQYSYGFTLCLLQIASPEYCVLIDPLAYPEILPPCLAFLQQSDALKLVHSSGEDLRLLHSLQCYATHVEDTETYARWMNLENTSLSALLFTYCGITIDKEMQRSNWTKRPLMPKQLEYASADVIHLFGLRNTLRKFAESKGLLPFIEEDIVVQQQQRFDEKPAYPFVKPADYWRYTPYELHVLNGMMAMRDTAAQKLNKPLHFVMPEKLLRDAVIDEKSLDNLPHENTVHRIVKQPALFQQWKKRFDELHTEATTMNLLRHRNKSSKDLNLKQIRQAEENIFHPIQKKLEESFGKFTARYILSNRMVTAMLRREYGINTMQHALKERLIKENAQALGIDISSFL